MRNGWIRKALGELINIKHGFAFKGEFIGKEISDNVLLTPGNFAIGGGFKDDKFKFYNGHVPDEFVLNQGDIIITMTDLSKNTDTLGYPAVVPLSSVGYRFLHNQRLGKVIMKNREAVNCRYLYYLMCTKSYRHEVLASATGTTVKHTAPDRIKQFQFDLPPIQEQRRIAHILSTLDDKIELNRQMNETLEATAHSIFKSWFVNFDPVKAKVEGYKPPCMNTETIALFPSVFQDSPLGEIPQGWKVEKMGNLVEIVKGRSYRSSELKESEDVALVSIKSIRRGGGYLPDNLRPYTGKYTPEQVITPGELVIAYTDLTQEAEILGKPAIVRGDEKYQILVPSHHLRIIRPLKLDVSIQFLYCLFRERHFQSHIYGYATGTTVLGLSKDGVPRYQFALPPEKIRSLFDSVAEPLFAKIESNENESRTLAKTRDTLLPKLLSGEIRVDAANEILEVEDG